jgi:hypothetical protein
MGPAGSQRRTLEERPWPPGAATVDRNLSAFAHRYTAIDNRRAFAMASSPGTAEITAVDVAAA